VSGCAQVSVPARWVCAAFMPAAFRGQRRSGSALNILIIADYNAQRERGNRSGRFEMPDEGLGGRLMPCLRVEECVENTPRLSCIVCEAYLLFSRKKWQRHSLVLAIPNLSQGCLLLGQNLVFASATVIAARSKCDATTSLFKPSIAQNSYAWDCASRSSLQSLCSQKPRRCQKACSTPKPCST
jgi:hypothetical protein